MRFYVHELCVCSTESATMYMNMNTKHVFVHLKVLLTCSLAVYMRLFCRHGSAAMRMNSVFVALKTFLCT